MSQADTPVIELRNVHKRFEQRPDLAQRILALGGRPIDRRTVYAVNGVDLRIGRGEVVGLVGESGCGKSTLGRVVAGLHRQTEGDLLYQGQDARRLRGADKLAYTLGVQMVFQDPQASLNPRQRLHQILGEALHVHKLAPPGEIPARIDQALGEVAGVLLLMALGVDGAPDGVVIIMVQPMVIHTVLAFTPRQWFMQHPR